MFSNVCRLVPLLIALTLAGCGGVQPVTGGTPGTLRLGGELLCEIQVTVHRVEGGTTTPVGFGVTDLEGAFELVTNGARGPLRLEPGEYRFTFESAGAPVQFAPECAEPVTTPIKATWSSGELRLNLDVPQELITR